MPDCRTTQHATDMGTQKDSPARTGRRRAREPCQNVEEQNDREKGGEWLKNRLTVARPHLVAVQYAPFTQTSPSTSGAAVSVTPSLSRMLTSGPAGGPTESSFCTPSRGLEHIGTHSVIAYVVITVHGADADSTVRSRSAMLAASAAEQFRASVNVCSG